MEKPWAISLRSARMSSRHLPRSEAQPTNIVLFFEVSYFQRGRLGKPPMPEISTPDA